MIKQPLRATTKILALVLIGASSMAGCDAQDDAFDDPELLSDDDGLEDSFDEPSFQADPALLDAIAEAPEIADEDVEALFADSEPTLRDVIRLVDVDALPVELTIEDLDQPVALALTEPPGDQAASDPADDFAAELEPQLIGEQACATASLSDPNDGESIAMSSAPNCGYAYDTSTSPNTSYNPDGCPNQYITHISGTSGEALSFYSAWRGIELDETYCELSSMALSAYGGKWVVQSFGGTWFITVKWTKFPTALMYGNWVPSGWFQGCNWAYESGGPVPPLPSGHGYSRIRTAVQGVVLAIFPFKQEVEGGIWHGPGPC